MAKAELIWIAENDDSCDKNLLERNVNNFIKNKDCVLSFVCSLKMDEKGILHETVQKIKEYFTLDGMVFNRLYLYRGCIIANASSALFKKDVAMKIDKRYTQYKGRGDRLFWIEIAEYGEVCYINEPLNFFHLHLSYTTKQLYADGSDIFMKQKKLMIT